MRKKNNAARTPGEWELHRVKRSIHCVVISQIFIALTEILITRNGNVMSKLLETVLDGIQKKHSALVDISVMLREIGTKIDAIYNVLLR